MEKMNKSSSYFMPTKILFGPGQLSRIGEEAKLQFDNWVGRGKCDRYSQRHCCCGYTWKEY